MFTEEDREEGIECISGEPNPKGCRSLDGGTEGFEQVRENAISRWSIGGNFRETLQDDRGQRPRNLRTQRTRRGRRLCRDARDERHQIAIVEWWPAREEVVQCRTDCVDVRPHVKRFATELLRRCELRRRLNRSHRRELHVLQGGNR